MILIITPYLEDFRRSCAANKIECTFNFNGMPSNPKVRWIRHPDNLYGVKIKEQDQIIYGEQAHKFGNSTIESIQQEISLRKQI